MKRLNCLNFVTAQAQTSFHILEMLTSHLFIFLTAQTSFHILDSWTILVYSIGHPGFLLHAGFLLPKALIWASLFGAHRSNVEVEDFIFHVVVFFRETFQSLAWKFLLFFPQKVFGVYIFS